MAWKPEDVISSPGSTDPNLQKTLALSDELEEAIWELLDPESYELASDEPKALVCFDACQLSMEHGQALRALISGGFDSTAAAVLRVQFEALARGYWALFSATDEQLVLITAPLTEESEKAATKLPMVTAMIKSLEGKGQPGMHQTFEEFRSVVLIALNSFVHAGIHSLRFHVEGYPPELLDRLVRYSNAMQTMAGMALANLTGDQELSRAMGKIQKPFEACLPHLLRPQAGPSQPGA